MPASARERPIQRVVRGVRWLGGENDVAMLLQVGGGSMIVVLDEARSTGDEVYFFHLSQLIEPCGFLGGKSGVTKGVKIAAIAREAVTEENTGRRGILQEHLHKSASRGRVVF
jgi:hypothetical protein